MSRTDLFNITTLLLILSQGPSWGQQLTMQVDAKEVASGSAFELKYVLHDATADRFFPPANFPGFKIRTGPSEVRSTGFRHGTMYRYQSWAYVLEAVNPGEIQLPPARASVSGMMLESNSLLIRITPSGKTRSTILHADNQDVIVSAEVTPASLYPGQQAVYRIALYNKSPVSSVSVVDIPELSTGLTKPLTRFDARAQKIILNATTYEVRTIYELAFFPQSPGLDTLGPSTIQVGIDQPSGIPGFSIPVSDLLHTPPVIYQVRPLPEPVPEDFSGAVGHFVMEAALANHQVPVGQGALLNLSLRGTGDPGRYTLPELPAQDGLDVLEPNTIDQESYENGEKWIHVQSVQYLLHAQKPGDYQIKPGFSFFHPDSNAYIRITPPQSMQLRVLEAPAGFLSPLPPPEGKQESQRYRELAIELIAFTAALCALIGLIWALSNFKDKQTKPTNPPNRAHQNPWLLVQKNRFEAPATFCTHLLFAIQKQLSDSCGLPPSSLSKATALDALQSEPRMAHIAGSVIEMWEHCERVVYANAPLWDSPEQIWKAAEQIRSSLQNVS